MPKRDKHDEELAELEDTEFESPAPTVDELQDEIERLRVELEEERARVKDEHERHLRALADFANYRRRHQDDFNRARENAFEELMLKILPTIDNFERALQAAEQNHSYESLVEGVKLTLRQLRDVLEKEGIKRIRAVGEQFDPSVHEAMMRVETDEYPENTIIEEVQPGYLHNERVIRPARVKVAVAPLEDVEG